MTLILFVVWNAQHLVLNCAIGLHLGGNELIVLAKVCLAAIVKIKATKILTQDIVLVGGVEL